MNRIRRSVAYAFAMVFAIGAAAESLGQTYDPQQAATPTGEDVAYDPEVKQTSWPAIPLPKITLPQIVMPDMTPITAPMKSGFSKLTAGTKSAWNGAREMFSWGNGETTSPQSNQAAPQQSFWSRIFSSEPPEPDVPQTVGEWMSQPRLDP